MILSLADMHALAAACAPAVAAPTLVAVAKVESGFDPLAIGVNGAPRVVVRARSAKEAEAKASALIAAGRSVDLGLAQINSRNLAWLGLTVEGAFDPCRNLAAAARVMQDGYARGVTRAAGEQPALRAALSYYNTGHPERGLRNGYVAKVVRAAAEIAPAAEPDAPEPPAWDVFAAAPAAGFVIHVSQGGPK